MSVDALRFRDNNFVEVSRSLREYAAIQQYVDAGFDFGFDLRDASPFAAFMGASYAVICGEHRLASPDAHPVVSFYQGVDLFFHSLEAMLATCIEWVRPSNSRSGYATTPGSSDAKRADGPTVTTSTRGSALVLGE